MIRACVDIGTNTALLLVARLDGAEEVLVDESRVIRLGQGVDAAGLVSSEALSRLEGALREFSILAEEVPLESRIAVATSATRDAKNKADIEVLCERYGFPLKVLSGDEEALFTFLGGLNSRASGPQAVIDVGGGSTEVVCGEGANILFKQSFDVGAVRMTERFISSYPTPPEQVSSMEDYVAKIFSPLRDRSLKVGGVIAVAGTPTTLAALCMGEPFQRHRVEGYRLSESLLSHWISKLASSSLEALAGLPGMASGREDVLLAGAVILRQALSDVGSQELTVSTRGLRYGVVLNWNKLGVT